jgi:hypothetical protein
VLVEFIHDDYSQANREATGQDIIEATQEVVRYAMHQTRPRIPLPDHPRFERRAATPPCGVITRRGRQRAPEGEE